MKQPPTLTLSIVATGQRQLRNDNHSAGSTTRDSTTLPRRRSRPIWGPHSASSMTGIRASGTPHSNLGESVNVILIVCRMMGSFGAVQALIPLVATALPPAVQALRCANDSMH